MTDKSLHTYHCVKCGALHYFECDCEKMPDNYECETSRFTRCYEKIKKGLPPEPKEDEIEEQMYGITDFFAALKTQNIKEYKFISGSCQNPVSTWEEALELSKKY